MWGLVGPGGLLPAIHIHNMSTTVAANWARSLCPHRRGSKRYRQWVEFYTWKYEKRFNRNVVWQSCALVHQCCVTWLLLRQALRLCMGLQALVMALAK